MKTREAELLENFSVSGIFARVRPKTERFTPFIFLEIYPNLKALFLAKDRKVHPFYIFGNCGFSIKTITNCTNQVTNKVRRYARRGVRGRQHQSDRQCCRHIGDGRNDSVTIFGHKMHQLVAVSPDMLIGQFFCECHRHNAEMTPALHFAQWLSGRSWDAILSNVFVNYVYNILPLQYPTMSRQVGL